MHFLLHQHSRVVIAMAVAHLAAIKRQKKAVAVVKVAVKAKHHVRQRPLVKASILAKVQTLVRLSIPAKIKVLVRIRLVKARLTTAITKTTTTKIV